MKWRWTIGPKANQEQTAILFVQYKKKLYPRILIIHRMTFECEYLGKLEYFQFEKSESEDQVGPVDEKKLEIDNLVQEYL